MRTVSSIKHAFAARLGLTLLIIPIHFIGASALRQNAPGLSLLGSPMILLGALIVAFALNALSILSVGLTSILAADCDGRQESHYPSLADAIKSWEMTRGWIPDSLRGSSRAIHIIYDPESAITWCAQRKWHEKS
jgi:hypothetical protein